MGPGAPHLVILSAAIPVQRRGARSMLARVLRSYRFPEVTIEEQGGFYVATYLAPAGPYRYRTIHLEQAVVLRVAPAVAEE